MGGRRFDHILAVYDIGHDPTTPIPTLLKHGASVTPLKVHRTVSIVTCMCMYGNSPMDSKIIASFLWGVMETPRNTPF